MDITYNDKTTSNKLVTFTDVPNILLFDEVFTGWEGTFSLHFQGNMKSLVTANNQFHITFLDEDITNVMNPSDATGKRFYISSDANSTAVSVAQALRSCASINANYTVGYGNGEVELRGKSLGTKWGSVAHFFDTNIPSAYMTVEAYDGDAYPEDLYMSKVIVDVVDGDRMLTTLAKHFYGDHCGFDMSPVLSTIAEEGKLKPYTLIMRTVAAYGTNAGKMTERGQIEGYVGLGYQANQSDRFKFYANDALLLNTNRNQLRYVYGTSIPFSVMSSGSSVSVTVTVQNEARTQLYSNTYSVTVGSGHIADTTFDIPANIYSIASYVNITAGGTTVKFKVIKPLNAAEYYQRIHWRNEYGGIEFFDFTGKRSESDSLDTDTYEKNIYDFYTNPAYESKKIYRNEVKKSVKATSHLLESDGRWFANSLMRSKRVWTTINGKKHYIIPTGISVEEDGTYNNVYTVQLTYEYSQLS